MRRASESGFTLIELLAVIAILGVLTAFALPQILAALESARIGRCKREISGIHHSIESWRAANSGAVPDSIDVLVPRWYTAPPTDPWGNPYVYNSFGVITPGQQRKDGPLVPINKEYDLFSTGRNGAWVPSIHAAASQDDVILANDGGFIGLPEDY